MPLDGLAVRAAICELQCLCGGSVQKIYQPERDELVLLLRSMKGNVKLLISASPSSPRLQLTSAEFKNPETAPMFCMLLRKHFTSSKLVSIRQHGLDRTADMTFDCRNEMGDTVQKHIILEMTGRSANILVTDGAYRIVDCLRKNDLTAKSDRLILPGVSYVFLHQAEKCDIDEAEVRVIDEVLEGHPNATADKIFTGFSPLAAREAEEAGSLREYVLDIRRRLAENDFTPCVILKGKRPIDFWCFVPSEYKEGFAIAFYPTMSEAMDAFYLEKDKAEHMKQKTAALTKLLTNLIARGERKLKIQMKELADAEKKDEYRVMGDLITANLYRIPSGVRVAEVTDWSSGEERLMHIPLDETISPSANAQRYYKKYTKAKSAEMRLNEQMALTRDELLYLNSVLLALSEANDAEDVAGIREELVGSGYLARETQPAKKKKELSGGEPITLEKDGFTIFVGKNNRQNDYLTLKAARANDLWLHVKNAAGSHVIIASGGRDVPPSVIEFAAKVAAEHSKAKGAPKTEVDYTLVKHVKKPSGAKPGMVIYTDYQTCVL